MGIVNAATGPRDNAGTIAVTVLRDRRQETVMSTFQFMVTKDKETHEARVARGVMVTTQAPKSALFADPQVQGAVGDVEKVTGDLKKAIDAHNTARAALKKARTALGTAVVAWDGSFDVLVSTAEKICVTDDDGASLGLPVGQRTKYAFAMPISVDLTHDLKKDLLRIHVKRAPGMKTVSVQVSTDLTDPAGWKELDGNGARHTIPNPAPGTYWVRAATRTATAKSEYTTPVSVIVK
jgi:hypothetical protein